MLSPVPGQSPGEFKGRNNMKNILLPSAIAIIAGWSCDAARTAEVTLIVPGGTMAALGQIVPSYEKTTGHKGKAPFGSGVGTREGVIKGEPFDVLIVQPPL